MSINGRKVFLLYPHSVFQDDLIYTLVQSEYEVYRLKDHNRALRILEKFPDSILFINIDERLDESEWEEYIRGIAGNPALDSIRIGILSYNNDEELKKKYLMDIGITCGFIQLKLGLKESTKIILTVLEASEAKGRRKFVRVSCEHDSSAQFNVRVFDTVVTGKIIDISSIGMAMQFDTDPELQKNTLLEGIQLRLRSSLINLSGVVMGFREEKPKRYVVLFTPKTAASEKTKIRRYIIQTLQGFIESLQV
ncbi:PilZ domain-containing protein [Marispirochaeta aestuarii]|uniref:PilZ domain-containing protein n=1 Tax=Marispirochaeta aestuarii TaxID=1963862 RepID=UPI002ABD70CC|nr:PilZ domain-containing protein [Marispirochaeta aestuarii]